MKITKYPDGTSYVEATYKLKQPHIIFRINSYEDLWHLNQYVDTLKAQKTRPVITIPNLIDAQADRRFGDNQSSGLKLVCEFLNNMEADFKIFHPHNPEVVEALMDNVEIIDNSKFISEVLYTLKNNLPVIMDDIYHKTDQGYHFDSRIMENTVLMASDAGSFKPLMKLCDRLAWGGQVHSCSKGRSFDGEKSELTQRIGKEDFFGKDICDRLEAKGFASTNVVLGIGSFTYQYVTRDTHGFAMKATYVEVKNTDKMRGNYGLIEGREIFKDPITGDGSKKSAKGLLCVANGVDGYELIDQVPWTDRYPNEPSEDCGALQLIFEDGKFFNETTLTEIRERLKLCQK